MNILQGQFLFSGLDFRSIRLYHIIITLGLISAELLVGLIVYFPWRSKVCQQQSKDNLIHLEGLRIQRNQLFTYS